MKPSYPPLADLDAWLAQREATVPALRPQCAKQIIWAGPAGQKTEFAVVYVHGFSATGQELRPLPDLIAGGLGANLFFTRLTGHGQDGAALGRARVEDWRADVDEALAIAKMLGRRVIAMGCSTGCTLLTLAMAAGACADAVVFVSPNFGLAHPLAHHLLKLPKVRDWGDYLVGGEQEFKVHDNDMHADYWTARYPTQAVYTMAETVRAGRAADLSKCHAPLYVAYNPGDQVVSAARTRRGLSTWGGAVHFDALEQTDQDDPLGHLMAGDVFSPNQTAPLAARVLAWLDAQNAKAPLQPER